MGNPFKVDADTPPIVAWHKFVEWIEGKLPGVFEKRRRRLLEGLLELRGKDLACYCALPTRRTQEDRCHAAVLLKLANAEPVHECGGCNGIFVCVHCARVVGYCMGADDDIEDEHGPICNDCAAKIGVAA